MDSKALNFLGLAKRANKLTIGCDSVVDSMAQGKSSLVLMAGDISNNTKKVILKNAKAYGVHTIIVKGTKDELSHALGRLTAVISVDDEGFARGLELKLADDKEECQYDD
ncbi:MAG: ribosomal L7Ae/L30e/S12e/Gadd45 family protein [Lachnospiraceae bacterium]|nr:ribosomal L7Ae/L30e/S12e/Gadd45 family protein [Lachnospiraceae bacterium]